jgi:microcystin-dependent protein
LIIKLKLNIMYTSSGSEGMAAIVMFAGNFAPYGWAFCNGQLQSIADNAALFSLLGTTYGGDGSTTFGLPDLRGRVPIGQGPGLGLSNYALGQMGGQENITLLTTQIPAHTHSLSGVTEAGTSATPTGNLHANTGNLDKEYATTGTPTAMNASAILTTGGSNGHSNMQPYLAVNYVICIFGAYPSRN